MKLTEDQIAATRDSLGASPLPEDHPALPQLAEAFGAHTFYVDQNGLLIFASAEEIETAPEADPVAQPKLILIARWTDESKSKLGAIDPVDTGVTLPEAA